MTNNNLTNNLTISRENVITAYDNTNDAGRELLENLFEKEVFTKDITERVKTFEDACNVLGDDHPLVGQYRFSDAAYKGHPMSEDSIAYLKLRIITAALNEGWEPQFTEDECRYFPWFEFFTQIEFNEMSDDEKGRVIKGRVVGRSGSSTNSYNGFVYCFADYDASFSITHHGSRLAFKTRELAEYAGRQFVELYADFIYGRHFSRKGVK